MNKSLLVTRIDFFYLWHNVSHTLIPKRNPEPGVIFSAMHPLRHPGSLLAKFTPRIWKKGTPARERKSVAALSLLCRQGSIAAPARAREEDVHPNGLGR